MAPRDRAHIFVPNAAVPEPYRARAARGPAGPPSPEDRSEHARRLRERFTGAVEEARARRSAAPAVAVDGAISGVYVQFESVPGFGLALTSLDPRRGRDLPELRAVTTGMVDDKTVELATVFVPDGQLSYFTDRFEQYATENTPAGNPKNKQLVDRINDIRLATVRALWTDDPSSFPSADQAVWWEVWLRRREDAEQRLAAFGSAAAVELGVRRLVFEDRVVVLVRTTSHVLGGALDVLDDIAELRRPAEPMQFLADLSAAEQGDFVRDLAGRLVHLGPNEPAVCVLDTGVSQAHPLLAGALAVVDCHSCHSGTGREDRVGHGTEMAGLALFGDVGQALSTSLPVRVRHRLESVQILPDGGTNPPQLYGAITAQAASLVEITAPASPRSFALAVTAEATTGADSDVSASLGAPTSWSATVDALAAGRAVDITDDGLVYIDDEEERTPRLFIVSAGNVRHPLDRDHLTRSDLEPVEDPGQAWNALTVGAWTDLVDLSKDQATFPGWQPLAPAGELSPFSRTSVGFQRSWPLKPEVVFEGGNAAADPASPAIDTPTSLQVLTTGTLFHGRGLLTTTTGTSPATAQAAHMSASISATYPSLWPETVRALIVHAARWTDRMRPHDGAGRAARVLAVRRYGWGVPTLDRALRSANDSVTLIAQDTLHPYTSGKMRELHLHDLPWPKAELEELGEQQVKLRVVLSYFVDPNPARRGWVRRFQYQSHGLRFELRRALEEADDFRRRLNRLADADDERRPTGESDAREWLLGPLERVRGSLHVDLWTGTAADLAARGMIAVYPVGGWWKEQPKRDRSDAGARYSLVVSIEAPDVDVDLWTPVAAAANVAIATVVET